MPKAAVLTQPGGPIEIQDFPDPELEPGGVLMDTAYSEICGTDVHLWDGRLAGVPYPIIPGHFSVGTVRDVAGHPRDVYGVEVRAGEPVTFLDVFGTCNQCWSCLVARNETRCPERKVYGVTLSANEGLLGGWSESVLLKPGTRLVRLPEGLTPKRFIAGGCALPTALHAVDRSGLKIGDDVVIQGAGPVGLSACALARLSGANRVVVTDLHENRLAMAREFGADLAVRLDPGAPEEHVAEVREALDGRGADVTIEGCGAPSAISAGIAMTRDGGVYIVVGHYTDAGTTPINPHLEINQRHITIRGTWGISFNHLFRSIGVLARHGDTFGGGAGWESIITGAFGLQELEGALASVRRGEVIKAAVVPGL